MRRDNELCYAMFHGYKIYKTGQIVSPHGKILTSSRFGNGQLYVSLWIDMKMKKFNKAELVYNSFSDTPFNSNTQTMSYLNGDRCDCSYDNLVVIPKRNYYSITQKASVIKRAVLQKDLAGVEYVQYGTYRIYRSGDIVSQHGNLIKTTCTPGHLPMVALRINGKQTCKSKARLIYNTFSEIPAGQRDKIIHVNGDEDDYSFDNLRVLNSDESKREYIQGKMEENSEKEDTDCVFYGCYRLYRSGEIVSPKGNAITPYTLTYHHSHVKLKIDGKMTPKCKAHLIYNAFSPEPVDFRKYVARFKDGNTDNCDYDNLVVIPRKECIKSSGKALFTPEMKRVIIDEYMEMVVAGTASMYKLACKYNCSMSTIVKIIHRA